MTIGGLKNPPLAEWGQPYLGLWSGFYQSVANKGMLRLFALRFFISDLGLRCEATEGNFKGEGPVIATRSHLQCLFDLGPLYDRVGHCMFHGVHALRAAVIDGLVCIIVGDSGGTPTASPIVVYRLDEDPLDETAEHMDALSAAIKQIHERADTEAARTGDRTAIMRELAPPEVFQQLPRSSDTGPITSCACRRPGRLLPARSSPTRPGGRLRATCGGRSVSNACGLGSGCSIVRVSRAAATRSGRLSNSRHLCAARAWRMIPKSVKRFSDKIMRKSKS